MRLLPSQPHRPAGPDEVRQRRLPLSCPAPRPGTSALLRRRLPPFPHSKKAGQRVVQPLTGAERPSPPVTHTRAVFPQYAAAHKGLIPPLCALRCCVIQSLVCGSDKDRALGTVDALAAALRTSRPCGDRRPERWTLRGASRNPVPPVAGGMVMHRPLWGSGAGGMWGVTIGRK